ncbi:MAG: sensor histidine kinase [Cytophagales bacterium]
MKFLFHQTYLGQKEKRKKAKLLAFSVLLSIFMYFFYLVVVLYAKFYSAVPFIIFSLLLLAAALVLLKTSLKFLITANLSLGATNILAFSCMYLSGGIHSPIILWMIAPPITALLISNRIISYVWAGISLAELGFLIFLDFNKIATVSDYNPAYDDFFYFSSFAGLMLVVFSISIMFEKMVQASKKSENNLNQELLLKNEELNIQTEEISSQRDMLYEVTQEMQLRQKEIFELNEQLEARIKSRTNELYLALKELDTFIYRSAHDIKGPLATISGLCYVAMFDVKDEKSASYLSKIQIQTQKTIHLLQRISGISELKKIELKRAKIDFKLLKLKLSRYIAEEDDAQFVKLNIDFPEINEDFYSDQHLVEQMVIDLFDNAIKFRDSFKEAEAYANLSIVVKDQVLQIRVEDNGLGISESSKESIFDMFFKGSDKSKGSGLGLFIVKIAVEKLNGAVILDTSTKGKTIFNVQIPTL